MSTEIDLGLHVDIEHRALGWQKITGTITLNLAQRTALYGDKNLLQLQGQHRALSSM